MSDLQRGIWHHPPQGANVGDFYCAFFDYWRQALGQMPFLVTIRDDKGYSYSGNVVRVDHEYVELERPDEIGDMAIPLDTITGALVVPDPG